MRLIIEMSANDESMREALNDIRSFQLQIVSRCTRDLLQEIEETGFDFTAGGVTGKKEELKAFLRAHPECMAGDIETIIDKISIFNEVTVEQRRLEHQKQLERIKSRRIQRKKYYTQEEDSDVEEIPKKPKKQEKSEKEEHSE